MIRPGAKPNLEYDSGMWPDSDKTRELLLQAGRGEPADALFERHRDALRRLIEMRLDRAIAARVDASDIVQETLIDASRRLADYLRDPPMPFHLWLRQIAKDRLIDAHRRHRVAKQRTVDREHRLDQPGLSEQSSLQLLQQISTGGLTPAAAAIRKEMEERFRGALEALSDTDREILLMRHFEQLTNQEVASALDLSEPAASMRYLRALKHLRGVLRIDEGGPGGE